MKGTRASIRYAKATLAFAQEAKAAQQVADDFKSLVHLLSTDKELHSAIENRMLPATRKEAILKELLPKASEQTLRFFALLAENNRMELLIPACEGYLDLYAEHKGEVKATVTSAFRLTPELEEKVLVEARKLSDKKAILENIIDPSIIGGYILKIGDMQYDASIAHQLKSIKTRLTKTNSI
jgi:F-type H+-transporting ATPase subunit delta